MHFAWTDQNHLVLINDFNVFWPCFCPDQAEPELVVDADVVQLLALVSDDNQVKAQAVIDACTHATITTRVQFAPLSPAEIEAYVATGEPLQCAAGFALEGRGGALVERIEGCFSNVIGLSLPLLRCWLAQIPA